MTAPLRLASPPGEDVRPSRRVATICDMLDCDESQVRRLLDKGEIEGHGLGSRGLRVYLDSVAAYQSRKAREAKGERESGGKPPERRLSGAGLAAHRSAVAELQKEGLM